MKGSNRYFISGIGTGIGKTVVSAILCEALPADYWKPVQAGNEPITDSDWVRSVLSNPAIQVHEETYRLRMPASPHISAASEGTEIDLSKICGQIPGNNRNLIIEGAGGLLVPLTKDRLISDLIKMLDVKLILVSRHYLGSINHSLLTAGMCRQLNIPVAGWVFNDEYLNYEQDIVSWSGYPKLFSVPHADAPDKAFVQQQASRIRDALKASLC